MLYITIFIIQEMQGSFYFNNNWAIENNNNLDTFINR